jgi:hypothetical protein
MDLSQFQFDLPERLIALRPAEPQDSARLLVVHGDGRLEDAGVRDLPRYLNAGDVLVFNDTRVLPAALKGVRPARDEIGQDVACDVNLTERIDAANWRALARPGRRLKDGDTIVFAEGFTADITGHHEGGEIGLRFSLGRCVNGCARPARRHAACRPTLRAAARQMRRTAKPIRRISRARMPPLSLRRRRDCTSRRASCQSAMRPVLCVRQCACMSASARSSRWKRNSWKRTGCTRNGAA